ncbi:hypothetical protein [Methanolapillus millepedarum]|uniref:Uncharacterized protein n=1 Tax=Methanolapillus millepedarum TaxID=3028296 RepID=A0AA96ZTZ8_9EURY|nr:hypothetical protein MsAc7_07020 [Methanosarcinaceae archaeon Ac7]
MFEWGLEKGLRPTIVGVKQAAHECVNFVADLFDVPPKSFVSLDELMLFYNARNSRGQSTIEDTSSLAVARHHERWVCTSVQVSSTGDLNFIKMCDLLIVKMLSLFSRSVERDSVTEMVPEYFVPKDKKTSFFMCSEFRCTVQLCLSKLWSEKYSTPFKILDKNTKEEAILKMFEDGSSPSWISDTIVAQSVRCTEAEVYEILERNGKIEKKKMRR